MFNMLIVFKKHTQTEQHLPNIRSISLVSPLLIVLSIRIDFHQQLSEWQSSHHSWQKQGQEV